MFVEFTRRSGTRITVNTDRVQYVSDSGLEGTYIYFADDQSLCVQEDYESVTRRLSGMQTKYIAAAANA